MQTWTCGSIVVNTDVWEGHLTVAELYLKHGSHVTVDALEQCLMSLKVQSALNSTAGEISTVFFSVIMGMTFVEAYNIELTPILTMLIGI